MATRDRAVPMIAHRKAKTRLMNAAVTSTRTLLVVIVTGICVLLTPGAGRSTAKESLPPDVIPVLQDLLARARSQDGAVFDPQSLAPWIDFICSDKSADAIYRASGGFDAPSAYHEFTIDSDLGRLIKYSLNAHIPSFFLWPSSLRMAQWTRVVGGRAQFAKLQAAADALDEPFVLKGTEHVAITPDQHTGAYYSYDVDKLVILSPFESGALLISIYRQQEPSGVGKKGWVLGEDDDWSYLYTPDTGLNVSGLGWARTYMYDSFAINVYYQPDLDTPAIRCGVVSWVRAGWAGINMVQSKHIHRGLVRAGRTFKAILEDPRLPDPAMLAKTFSQSRNLPDTTLHAYARDYFDSLVKRVAACESLCKKMGGLIDTQTLLTRMNRDELYAMLAKDYFKKLLGRNPVMDSHPF